MSGFDQLEQAIDQSVAQAPILPEQVAFSDEDLSDEVALGIVLQDAQASIAYNQSKGLVPLGIENADDLVRGFVRPRQWPDGKPRANLSMHVTLMAIEKILPQLYMSLFGAGKKKPFIVEAVGKTKPEAARAKSNLLWWAMKQAKTVEEMRLSLKTSLTYGLVVGSWGWESKKIRQKVYARQQDGSIKGTWETEDFEIPTYECLDLKMVLVDPGLKRQSVQHGAKFVIKQIMTTANDLNDLRDNPAYKNIPSNQELAYILANNMEITEDSLSANKRAVWRDFQAELESKSTSKDPLQQPLELLEYTTEDRIITVLQRKIVIRNEPNEFARLNFVSCAYIDVLNSAWGFGVAKLLAGEQRLQQGVVNNWIDGLALVLNPVYQLLKGIGPGTQTIPVSPGKVITESGELKPLVTPDITQPAMTAIETSDERASKKVGASGGENIPNPALRTAQGVNAFAGDVIQRLQYFLEIFINTIYIPVLEAFLEMMGDHLTEKQIQQILSEEDGKAYEGDIVDVYNAKCNVDVLAGANMMAKFAAAQLAPMLIQLVSAGPVQQSLNVQGKKFNYAEFIAETIDMLGWDVNNLIVDMTPDDLQRLKEQNAALQRVQGDMQLQDQKHQDDLELANEKGTVQAGVAVVKQAVKSHIDQAQSMLDTLHEGAGEVNGQ